MSDVKRSYSSDLRAEQARRTRWQIVTAARELFEEHGFAATTIEAVAQRAGVSRKTVFTAVGNKVELLHKAFDYAIGGDDEDLHLTERPALQRIIAEENPWEKLRMFGRVVADIHERITPVWRALRGGAELDPDARTYLENYERERRMAMLHGPVPQLIAAKALKPELTAETAADLLWTFNDPALYERLVMKAGWSTQAYGEWLAATLPVVMLVPEPTKRRGR